MKFSHTLRVAFDEIGGRTPENFETIAALAREVQPDMSPKYLVRLFQGLPPRPEDRQALAVAFGKSPSSFIDEPNGAEAENLRRVRNFAFNRLKRPDLVDEFLRFVQEKTAFRNKVLHYNDLYALSKDFFKGRGISGQQD